MVESLRPLDPSIRLGDLLISLNHERIVERCGSMGAVGEPSSGHGVGMSNRVRDSAVFLGRRILLQVTRIFQTVQRL